MSVNEYHFATSICTATISRYFTQRDDDGTVDSAERVWIQACCNVGKLDPLKMAAICVYYFNVVAARLQPTNLFNANDTQ